MKVHMRRHIDAKPMIEATAFEMMGKPNAEKNCVCKICNASFSRIANLRSHIRSHGATDPSLQSRIDTNLSLSDLYQITNKSGWELTFSDSETEADDSCDEGVDDTSTAFDLKVDSIVKHRMHTCGSCKRSFDRRYRLVVHMNFEHAKTKSTDFERFHCPSCNQPYPNEQLLLKHRRDQCENVHKKFFCKKCGVRFEWASSLEMHTSKAHQNYIFQCDACGKQFHRSSDYARHRKSHVKKKKKDTKPKSTVNEAFIYPREFSSNGCRRVGDSKGRRGGLVSAKLVFCDICQKHFSRKDNLK